ncbi:MAG: ABC transporter ATP-binding protein/permease [Bacteroidia bacterium]|nr:ABC transporter ATP-binding protein/permease [Bacteroidia bacterium]NNJ55085.1 ABC transporter ATP-binding protein [Bacteroidia bacterium]
MKKIKSIADTWVRLLSIFSKKQKSKYMVMVFLSVLSALIEIAGISVLLHTVLSILKPNFIQHNVFTSFLSKALGVEDQIHFVAIITCLLFIFYVVKNVVIVQINKSQVKFAFEATDDLSAKRYSEIANNDLLYFKNRKSSEIINELFGAALFLPETIIIPSIMLLSELSILVLMLGSILFYKPFLFLFTILTIMPAAGFLIFYNKNRLGKMGKEVHKINPTLYENISQLTQGIASIKLWKGTSYFEEEFEREKAKLFKFKKSIYVSSQFIPMRLYEVVAIGGILCVVLFALVTSKGNSSLISYVSIYAAVSFRMLPSVNRILGAFNNLATNSYVLDYFKNEISETVEKPSLSKAQLKFNEVIKLENFSFSYSSSEVIFKNLDFELRKGDFIGITGASGAGKSTFINLLCRLFEPTEGILTMDNLVINEDNKEAYRYLFSYVKQDVFMLNTSIMHNVAFLQDDEDVNLEKVKLCLAQVNLLPWVESLPNKWNTSVGELGNQISGGQKQRIAIARALYKEAEIFIFDEATNNLDKESITQTLDSINHLKEAGKTAIFITHKKEELKMCNKVYQLKGQHLIEI